MPCLWALVPLKHPAMRLALLWNMAVAAAARQDLAREVDQSGCLSRLRGGRAEIVRALPREPAWEIVSATPCSEGALLNPCMERVVSRAIHRQVRVELEVCVPMREGTAPSGCCSNVRPEQSPAERRRLVCVWAYSSPNCGGVSSQG